MRALGLRPNARQEARRQARQAVATPGTRWRTNGRGLAAALGAALLLAVQVPSVAAPGDEVQEARDRLEAAQGDAARAAHRLEQLGRDAEIAVERYNKARLRLDTLRGQMDERTAELARIGERMGVHQGQAEDFARRLYRRGVAYELEALLGADNFSDVQVRAFYLRSAAQAQLNVVEALQGNRRERAARLAELERMSREAEAAEEHLAAEREHVEATLASQRDEVARLRAVASDAEAALTDAERAELDRLERERLEREAAEAQAREQAARERAIRAAQEAAAAAARRGSWEDGAGYVPPTLGGVARIAVEAALSQLGKPYVYGGSGPDGFDCSGLTMWAWSQAGIHLSHSADVQFEETRRISREDLQPGDLVFFGDPIHHEAMYIGDGKVVEAPYTGEYVRINPYSLDRPDLVGYGRPVP